MRSQLLVRVLAGAMLAGAMLFTTAAHEAGAAPKSQPAKVTLDGTGVTWQWEDSRFSGSLRCEAGAVKASLEIKVTSGGTVGQETMTNVTCDGKTHRFDMLVRPHVGVLFPVGRAWVEARLMSEHPVTGAPLKEGRAARNLWIRPSGKVTPLWPLVINGDGTMTVRADALCRGPWLVQGIGLEVQQPGDPQLRARDYLGYPDVPCDGKKHRVTFTLEPPAGKSFVTKPSAVQFELNLEDPVEFDPVAQWWASATVTTVRR